MNSISVVFTVHEEIGRANLSELLGILKSIQPEVVFLEAPSASDYVENCWQQNLESKAITRYREGHCVDLIPVDIPTPPGEFFSSFESLRGIVRNESPEYRRLMYLDSNWIFTYGFLYLNSKYCSEHWSAVHDEMAKTITKIGDRKLNETFELWNATSNCREKVMMERIQSCCGNFTFRKGAFLVGAAHRQRILEISSRLTGSVSGHIQWNFADAESGVLTVSTA